MLDQSVPGASQDALDAERAVLGSVLIDQTAISEVMGFLHPEDFYDPRHRLIYGAMLALYDDGRAADIVTLVDKLNSHATDAGGVAYLSRLAGVTPTSINIAQYGQIVARKATQRKLIAAAGRIAAIAYEGGRDIASDIARVETELRRAIGDADVTEHVEVETWDVQTLADMPGAEDEFIISSGILTKGGKLLLYAGSGAGKTTLLDFIAGPLATGRSFLGKYAIDRPRKVLIIQGELSRAEMSSHAQQLVAAGYNSPNLVFARMTDLKLPKGEGRLMKLIEQEQAEIVALDPWYRLFSGESSDKPEQVGMIFDVCDRILEGGRVEAAIVVHHANVTGQRTAGSWVFEGWPSTILRLEAVAGVEAQRILVFEKIRAPSSDIMGKRIQITLTEKGYFPVDTSWEPPQAGPELARIIVTGGGGQMRRKDLIERLMAQGDCKLRLANQWLGEAVQGGLLGKMDVGMETIYQSVSRKEEF